MGNANPDYTILLLHPCYLHLSTSLTLLTNTLLGAGLRTLTNTSPRAQRPPAVPTTEGSTTPIHPTFISFYSFFMYIVFLLVFFSSCLFCVFSLLLFRFFFFNYVSYFFLLAFFPVAFLLLSLSYVPPLLYPASSPSVLPCGLCIGDVPSPPPAPCRPGADVATPAAVFLPPAFVACLSAASLDRPPPYPMFSPS